MANLKPIRTMNKNVVEIAGRFRPNGSSAVSNTYNVGRGWTVARSNTGLFTITMTDRFTALNKASAVVWSATAQNLKAQIAAFTVGPTATATVQIRLVANGTATDMASDAGSWVSFGLSLRSGQSV